MRDLHNCPPVTADLLFARSHPRDGRRSSQRTALSVYFLLFQICRIQFHGICPELNCDPRIQAAKPPPSCFGSISVSWTDRWRSREPQRPLGLLGSIRHKRFRDQGLCTYLSGNSFSSSALESSTNFS